MASNNLLVNNEARVLYEEQTKIERSPHNLSQSRKFPCDVGFIYPFFCRKTLPSDSFKIWSNILVKQLQPLLVPQMVSFTVNTAFYWVDYSLAFPDFEYFLINQNGSQDIELPYIRRPVRQDSSANYSIDLDFTLPSVSPTSISSFLDISINKSDEKIDALPYYTYYRIYRDFYLNIDRLSDSQYKKWFPGNGKDVLVQGENYSFGNLGLDGTKLNPALCVPFYDIYPHNVRGDYFVNSYPTPLRGDVPVLISEGNIDTFSATLQNSFVLDSILEKKLLFEGGSSGNNLFEGEQATILGVEGENQFARNVLLGQNYNDTLLPLLSSSTDKILGDSLDTFGSINANFIRINDLLTNPLTFNNLQNLKFYNNISTRQLRLLESLTRKREIDILMKPRLKNYLHTYFGVNRYKDDSLYQPVFIGSTTQQILINDIAQTTATSDSPLGRQGATAMSLGSGYVGEYYCRNYGCLMGLMYILPDYDYEPAIPKEWTERVPDEFVNPEFAHLSMSPILNKELFVSNDYQWNNQVLGYGGMYDNYRTSTNLVCGQFLDPDYADIRQFAQVRRFTDSNKPEITTTFLNSNSAFDKTVFAVPTLPPFIAQCVARVEAVRPLPEVAIPRG